MSVSLEKKIQKLNLEKKAPQLVSLAKKANITLEKKGFVAHEAQVALIMDISGSMKPLFRDGTVQELIARTMALGIHFDDNGAIDIFAFGKESHNLGEMTADLFSTSADWIVKQTGFEGNTLYSKPMMEVARHYGFCQKRTVGGFFGFGGEEKEVWVENEQFEYPIYAFFVTDGDNNDRAETRRIIFEISKYPVFFQFIGIGKNSFSFLEELDNIEGRELDNANFFAVPDPKSMSPENMFDKMMEEYPQWVKDVQQKGWLKK